MLPFAVSAALTAALMANKVVAGALTVSEAPLPTIPMVTSTVYATSAVTFTTCEGAARCTSPSTTVITVTTAISTTICPAESAATSVLSTESSAELPASSSAAIVSSVTADTVPSSPIPSSALESSIVSISSDAPISPSGGLSLYLPSSSVVESSLITASSAPAGITADAVSSSSAAVILSSSAKVITSSINTGVVVSSGSPVLPPLYSGPASVTQSLVPSSEVVSIVSSAVTQDNIQSSGGLVNPPPMSYPVMPIISPSASIIANPSATSSAVGAGSPAPVDQDTTIVETVSLDRTMTATVIPIPSSNVTTLTSMPITYALTSITPGVTANPNAVSNGTASGPMATPSVFTGAASTLEFAISSILAIVAIAGML